MNINSGKLYYILLFATLFLLGGCAASSESVKTEPSPPSQTFNVSAATVNGETVNIPQTVAQWTPILLKLHADGFEMGELVLWFSDPDLFFDPQPMKRKLTELYRLSYQQTLIKEIQSGLTRLGYTPGNVDGRAGGNTRRAIKAFQQVHGIKAEGNPSRQVLAAINADLALPESKRPAPKKTLIASDGRSVYNGYLTKNNLKLLEDYYFSNKDTLEKMSGKYGVPAEVVAGILMVETRFGEFLGNDPAFRILAGMSLSADFKIIEPHLDGIEINDESKKFLEEKAGIKGAWAYNELKSLLLHVKENKIKPMSIPGSIYGAIGISQFMPSNVLLFGSDGNSDGMVNLFDIEDAIFSVGSYFKGHGWEGDMSSFQKRQDLVLKYNYSRRYANTVLALADHLETVKNRR